LEEPWRHFAGTDQLSVISYQGGQRLEFLRTPPR
jgi:hypothetical protein